MAFASAARRHSWSNVAGFVFFAALGISLLVRMPEASLLLAPSVGKELFTALMFLMRDAPRRTASTLQARAAAYVGAFWMMVFLHGVRTWRPDIFSVNPLTQVAAFGGVLWLAGAVLVVVAMWSLRYAFSIEPQARRIVRTGPYRIVRHPVYAAYVLQYIGIWLMFPSSLLGAAMLIWFAITLIRMRLEERVLAEAFPEYERYREVTGALLPVRFPARVPVKAS